MQDHVSDLGWWLRAILLVLEDVECGGSEKESFRESVRSIITQPDRLAILASVGQALDTWLEVPGRITRMGGLLSICSAIQADGRFNDLEPTVMVCLARAIDLVHIDSLDLLATQRRIQAIRTVLYGLKKWKLDEPHAVDQTSRETRAVARWLTLQDRLRKERVERERRPIGTAGTPRGLLLEQVKYLLAAVLADFEGALKRAYPRIGPGGVAEGLSTLQKWDSLTHLGPFSLLYPFEREADAGNLPPAMGEGVTSLPDEDCLRWDKTPLSNSKLTAVPKDWDKDRLITVEPNTHQFWQQLVRTALLECMRGHGYTKHIDLSDQGKQGMLAAMGSAGQVSASVSSARDALERGNALGPVTEATPEMGIGDRPATLDFSDASDLITWDFVKEVFPMRVVQKLGVTRCFGFVTPVQRGVDSPPIPTETYAGMGNATTFVVETLVFWAVCVAKIMLCSPSRGYRAATKLVNVYGDDVIVPTWLCTMTSLFQDFESLGWKLNTSKSFFAWGGVFRESCGKHMWRGRDVTPTRFSGYNRNLAQDMVALASKVNDIAECHPTLCQHILNDAGTPIVNAVDDRFIDGTNVICVPWLPNIPKPPSRWSRRYQRWEIQCWCGVPDKRSTSKATTGLYMASLLGYSYSTWKRVSEKTPGRDRIHKSILAYQAAVPRRLHLEQKWFPTTLWGRDDDPAVLFKWH